MGWLEKIQRYFFPERDHELEMNVGDDKVTILPNREEKAANKPGAKDGRDKITPDWGDIMVLEPTTYEDGETIGEAMRSSRTLIINLSKMTSKNDATRLLDFICGVAFALDGNISKVSENEPIWLFTNKHVRITKTDFADTVKNVGKYTILR